MGKRFEGNLPAADDHSHVAAMLRRLGPMQRKYFYLCQPYLPDEKDQIEAIQDISGLNAIDLALGIQAMRDD